MKYIDITKKIIKIKKNKEILFVSICGSADTGKSTMSSLICDELKKQNIKCDFICTDSFMIDRVDRIRQEITGYNLKCLKKEALFQSINYIQQKKEFIYFPYDNRTGKNLYEYKTIKDVDILIIEGIHSLNEIIRDKMDLKIFIDSDDKTLRKLRFNANINKRRFLKNEARKRIDKEMEEYYSYVEPNKKYADITISIDENYNYH